MLKTGLFVRLEAKPGQEQALERFLCEALPLAQRENGTVVWFALKLAPSVFAIFDAFADEAGREQHLSGQIAAALGAKAGELLSAPPAIETATVLAAKLPG